MKLGKHKTNISVIIAVLTICLCEVERLDFFYGTGSFRLTLPFIMSVLCLIFVTPRMLFKYKYFKLYGLKKYEILLFSLLVTVFVSFALSEDKSLSFNRMILLFTYSIMGWSVLAYLFSLGIDLKEVLLLAARIESVIYIVFSIIDVLMWKEIVSPSVISSILPGYDTKIGTIGYWIVRVKGASGDPNRCGMVLILCAMVILWAENNKTKKFIYFILDIVFVLLTVSRTAFLSLFLAGLVWIVSNKKMKNRKMIKRVILMSFLTIIVLCLVVQIPTVQTAIDWIVKRIASGTNEGSASDHVSLLHIGLDAVTSDFKIFFFGNGYGTSNLLLNDFFGNSYGNFHNAFLTLWIESGIFSLFVFILIIIIPLIKQVKARPVMIVILVFNFFYQGLTEPYTWIVLAFVWMSNGYYDKDRDNKRSGLLRGKNAF